MARPSLDKAASYVPAEHPSRKTCEEVVRLAHIEDLADRLARCVMDGVANSISAQNLAERILELTDPPDGDRPH